MYGFLLSLTAVPHPIFEPVFFLKINVLP